MNLRQVNLMWTEELYNIYENCYGKEGFDILPIFHSTANAQVEITIDEEGNFVNATRVDKESSETIIPVTENSGSRSSGIAAMPLADKLAYIAADYQRYYSGKRSDNSEYFKNYIDALKSWAQSNECHKGVKAIYNYIEKGNVIGDLIKSNVLDCNEDGQLASKVKINGISQEDAFVRFRVNYKDLFMESKTWLDKTLYDNFIEYNNSIMETKGLCYITGETNVISYKHPSKILNPGDKGKLISANDESGFTYRGRFKSKEETLSVGYSYSQKLHNALKWLIKNQGFSLGNMKIITWASLAKSVPDINKEFPLKDNFDEFDEEEIPNTQAQYSKLLKESILSYRENFDINTKVMVMGLDEATTGRISVSMYSELSASKFMDNVERWHNTTVWHKFYKKKKYLGSFSVYEIAKNAYGDNDKAINDGVLRLIPCITEGRKIPFDIVTNLYRRASNPQSFSSEATHLNTVAIACAMIKKYNIDNKKGVISLGYDPKETDRSYLYGCLLAIADKTERDTYEKDEQGRTTNARRYWNMFAQRPYQTWKIIEERLNPYLAKSIGGALFMKRVGEITEKMSLENFKNNSPLEPSYLLGFHHYNSYMYTSRKNEDLNKED